MRRYRNWIFTALLALLFIEIWIGFPISLEKRSEQARRERAAKSSSEDLGSSIKRMEGVHLVESRAGDRDWELFAQTAEEKIEKTERINGEKKHTNSWNLKVVRVLFYTKQGQEFEVMGNEGYIDGITRNITIRGNVLTKTANGYHFKTSEVEYVSRGRILRSHSKILIDGPPPMKNQKEKPLHMQGQQMVATIDTGLIKISGGVVTEKGLSEGKTMQIHSDSSNISTRQRVVGFGGHVEVQLDTMKVESPEVSFVYKDDADMLQSVLISGGAKLSDRDKMATAEQVRFEPQENKFTLTGQPRVLQGGDEIYGDRIVFIDGGKKVKVENIKAISEKK